LVISPKNWLNHWNIGRFYWKTVKLTETLVVFIENSKTHRIDGSFFE